MSERAGSRRRGDLALVSGRQQLATIPSSLLTAMRNAGAAPDALTNAVLAILAAPPAQQPGTFQYANSGYMIAGAALEQN